MFYGRGDKVTKQGMRLHRFGLEFRMKLAAEKPGMFFQFNNLHKIVVRRCPGDHQTLFFQLLSIVVVELVAMTVPL